MHFTRYVEQLRVECLLAWWVEVDGGYHSERVVADARRDRVLQRLGYRVLRLPAELVRYELPEAVAQVRLWLSGDP